ENDILEEKEKNKRKAKAKAAANVHDDEGQAEKIVWKNVSRERALLTDEQGSTLPDVNIEKPTTVKEIGHELFDLYLVNEVHGDNADGIFGLRSQPSLPKRPGLPPLPWPKGIMILVWRTLFPKAGEFNESHVEKLREVFIVLHKPPPSLLYAASLSYTRKHSDHSFSLKDSKGKVITMAEFLRLPNFKGCKVAVEALLPLGTARTDEQGSTLPDVNVEKPTTVKEIGHELVDPYLVNEVHGDNADGLFELRSQPSLPKRPDGISIGRKDSDIQAILADTPNVDPVSFDTFMETYEKLFEKRAACGTLLSFWLNNV
nr:hypothetical protein [Tanacetum cinerariifolium]